MCFGAGWVSHEHYVGYQQNIEKIVQDEVKNGISLYQRDAAQHLLDVQKKIDGLTPGNTIERETITLQPIYSNKCIDESGVNHTKKYQNELLKSREIHQ